MRVLSLAQITSPQPAAPAQREGRDEHTELTRLLRVLEESHVLNVLEWLGGLVLVLNTKRQVVRASQEILRELSVDADALLGERPGEVLGCAYAAEAPGGCGTHKACAQCGVMNSIPAAQAEEVPVEADWKIKLHGAGGSSTLKVRLKAAPLQIGGDRFTVFVAKRRAGDGGWIAPQDWPSNLETYGLVRTLGVGGMGSVFLVEDANGARYALKTLRHQVTDEANLARFRQETELALKLVHPNVVKTYEVDCTSEGTPYMVSEYCSYGSTLTILQDGGPLRASQALVWLWEAVSGLNYAWREHGVVHRDIKPDNLLIGTDHQLKIADYGLAYSEATDMALTRQGTIVGTPYYMSPEQWRGAKLDIRSDLYSLGASFYHLLSGRRPFTGKSASELSTAHQLSPPKSLQKLAPNVPEGLSALIHSLLAKLPCDRPSAEEVLEQLATLASEVDLTQADSEPALTLMLEQPTALAS
ncbi:MAG: serine/threonine protein kinase [Planctomycetes bacterium]|nr:serine/threonine protein kinase [Planctomycetota bacterium]